MTPLNFGASHVFLRASFIPTTPHKAHKSAVADVATKPQDGALRKRGQDRCQTALRLHGISRRHILATRSARRLKHARGPAMDADTACLYQSRWKHQHLVWKCSRTAAEDQLITRS